MKDKAMRKQIKLLNAFRRRELISYTGDAQDH